MKNLNLKPPCTYQGAKQRVAKEIVDKIFADNKINDSTKFYDLCCGTGTITLELMNRGIKPENIVMLDKSSWGLFWKKVGDGEYNVDKFNQYIDSIPKDKNKIKDYLEQLSKKNANIDEEYVYLLLQAGSFGGKQVWKEENIWKTQGFRNYWQPTSVSIRRSPINPIQPMPKTIKQRANDLVESCKGLTSLNIDIFEFLEYIRFRNIANCIFYIDPPYKNTTGYGFCFDWEGFIEDFVSEMNDVHKILAPIYVSECRQYSDNAILLNFKGAKGGISGKKKKNQEWLNVYNVQK